MRNKVLFYILLFLIWVPLLQLYIFYKAVPPLEGAVKLRENPDLTNSAWFLGRYQVDFENYINDNIGCRPLFVRIKNQIYYSLFKIVKAEGVVIGKNNYLFGQNYIDTYNGKDFIGNDSIHDRVLKIKELQNELALKNKTFIICIAPGKGSFLPKYFPEKDIKPVTSKTNYLYFKKHLTAQNINLIDYNDWFLKMKDTCDCPLYPQYGIHWSLYGAALATDSLVKYIEHQRGVHMPRLTMKSIEKSVEPRGTDYDIGTSMNLLVKTPNQTALCYPQIEWESGKNLTQPKVLTIADSFYRTIFDTQVQQKSFSAGAYWYYNKEVYTISNDVVDGQVSKLNLKQEILKNDVIVILATEANLAKLGWGFIDEALVALKK